MNYYQFLGVEESATTEEINRAYRKLALRYHPDKPDNNDAMFCALTEVKETLTDGLSRARYNRNKVEVSVDGIADITRLQRQAAKRQRLMMLRNYRWECTGDGFYVLEHVQSGTVVQRMSDAQVRQIEVPLESASGQKLPGVVVLKRRLKHATELFLQANPEQAQEPSSGGDH